MSIKAVAFDYGGVISLPQDEWAMREMASIAGINPVLMKQLYWKNRSAYDRGTASGPEYFRDMLAGAGIFPDCAAIGRMIEVDLRGWAKINPETETLMNDVKKAGLKLGILSNMIQPFIDWARVNLPVFSLPDAAVYSCETGVVKPEKKIYDLLLAALDCGSDELVFFDDAPVNVEAAGQMGIQAFVWNGPESARRELELLCAGRL